MFSSIMNGAEWSFRPAEGGLCVEGCRGSRESIVVPPAIDGLPVVELSLDSGSLTGACRSLSIPGSVRLARLDFSASSGLESLDFPDSARLASSPTGIEKTPWFINQGPEPVYIGGFYCGTPGGGWGRESRLVIRPGTVAIASCADFHCFWHSIEMPDSVKTIGQLAFADSRCLERLHLPAGVESIGDFAFQFCPRLRELRLPDSLCRPTAPFMLCTGLREVSMAEGCPIKTKFSFCSRIVYRREGKSRVEARGIIPTPILGRLHACPAGHPISAAGQSYADAAALSAAGQEVRDEPLPGEAPVRRWYFRGPGGLTEVRWDSLCRVYMVWEDIPEDALPPELRSRLEGTALGRELGAAQPK